MAIKHGVYVYEDDTAFANPLIREDAIVCIGRAPLYLKENGEDLFNKPILCNSAQEAMDILGYSDDWDKWTLCQMMWVTANLFPVGPVVYIPVRHEGIAIYTSGATTIESGATSARITDKYAFLSGFKVKQGTGGTAVNFVLNEDYTVEYDADGYATVTINTASTKYNASLDTVVEYTTDVATTTDAAVIGTYNSSTGVATGAELIPFIYPRLSVVPSLICAPGFSKSATVGAALYAKAANINGVFKAMAVLDIESTTTRTYTAVRTAKETADFVSPFCYPVWPAVKVKGKDKVMALSTIATALMAYTDARNNGIPSRSPSNKIIGRGGAGVVATCLEDGTEIVLTQDQATTINGYGVNTAINLNGWRLFGSYTGAYPAYTDVKDIWCPTRRMFNWQGNNFIQLYFEKVDDPLNIVLIESIIDSENIRCAAFAPDHWAGARMSYLASDNPTEQLLAGKIVFRQYIAPYPPAQEIDNILSYDVSLLTASLETVSA
jgi:hypothetical protein